MIRNILIKIGSSALLLKDILTQKNSNEEIKDPGLEYIEEKRKIKEQENLELEEKINNEIIDEKREVNNINPYYILIAIIVSILFLVNMQIAIEVVVILFIIYITNRNLPKIRKDNKRNEILKMLPFALRQLSTQLKAGIGLFDAMNIIAESNYGELSEEFSNTLQDIQYGTNYIEAFDKLSKRVDAKPMDNIINQLTRTLTNGGNLSDTLNTLASENSKNMKIKYQEYSQKLNSIMLLYMFVAVLIPVILFVMIIAATTVMGEIVQPQLLLILYLFFFPMIVLFMIIFIRNMEPTL